jgi:hypothetical protein
VGVRGRKSSAELTLIQRAEEILVVRRPDPPDYLGEEAAAEWRAIVNSMPADHFNRAVQPILEAYCGHAVAVRRIDQLIRDLEDGEGTVGAYARLLTMRGQESRSLGSLAVRLALAYATREFKSFGGKKEGGPRPWEKLSR